MLKLECFIVWIYSSFSRLFRVFRVPSNSTWFSWILSIQKNVEFLIGIISTCQIISCSITIIRTISLSNSQHRCLDFYLCCFQFHTVMFSIILHDIVNGFKFGFELVITDAFRQNNFTLTYTLWLCRICCSFNFLVNSEENCDVQDQVLWK